MKRTNVIVDEELLEKARVATGEKTYSGAINKALEELVKKHDFWAAYDRFAELAAEGDFFYPGYVDEIRGRAIEKKKRVSAHEKRAPRKKSSRR